MYRLLTLVLLAVLCRTSSAKVDVRLHGIIPHFIETDNELRRALHQAFLFVRRDRNGHILDRLFQVAGTVTFLRDDSPTEILNMFCKDVLAKDTVVLLIINNHLKFSSTRGTTNTYILELAHSMGIPVISWDSQFSGAQVRIIYICYISNCSTLLWLSSG